jgi:hypothetical protein
VEENQISVGQLFDILMKVLEDKKCKSQGIIVAILKAISK